MSCKTIQTLLQNVGASYRKQFLDLLHVSYRDKTASGSNSSSEDSKVFVGRYVRSNPPLQLCISMHSVTCRICSFAAADVVNEGVKYANEIKLSNYAINVIINIA